MTYLARVGGRLQLHVYMSKFYVVGENWGKGGGSRILEITHIYSTEEPLS